MRRLPAPWAVEEVPGGFRVLDAEGKKVACIYGQDVRGADWSALTRDEARRVAANIATLPALLRMKPT